MEHFIEIVFWVSNKNLQIFFLTQCLFLYCISFTLKILQIRTNTYCFHLHNSNVILHCDLLFYTYMHVHSSRTLNRLSDGRHYFVCSFLLFSFMSDIATSIALSLTFLTGTTPAADACSWCKFEITYGAKVCISI